MQVRTALSLVLLASAVVLVVVLAGVDTGTPAGAGRIQVTVVFPGAEVVGEYVLQDATAYTALQAIAADHGWIVEVSGAGEDLFVEAINGTQNAGAGGWCYGVWDDGFHRPPYSAAVAGLRDGQAVIWSYEPDGCGSV